MSLTLINLFCEIALLVCLGIPLGRVKIGTFADGEVTLEILDEVSYKVVVVYLGITVATDTSTAITALNFRAMMSVKAGNYGTISV